MLTFGSVCSGIEAASVAWEPLGWQPSFFSEIEAFPRAVLHHRFPGVHVHGDFTTIKAGQYEPINLLVGGTPCQSFSIAGLRSGLGDDRGNLALEFLRLADRLRPRWLVWENVPGVLSSGGGRDFGAILGGLVELGYGFAYRVLDAQHVRVDGLERAVPQRRRRVFVVGYLGDWRRAAAVLFERESLCGHPPPRREAGQRVADSLTVGANQYSGFCGEPVASVARPIGAGSERGSGYRLDADTAENLIASTGDIAHCLNAGGMGRIDYETETMIAFNSRENPEVTFDRSGPLGASSPQAQAIAFTQDQVGNVHVGDVMHSLSTNQHASGRAQGWAVRRLTPTECERLQGFPDGWTAVPYRGKPAADGNRYKALGNSMAVNVMRWLGRRIELVDTIPSLGQIPAMPVAAE